MNGFLRLYILLLVEVLAAARSERHRNFYQQVPIDAKADLNSFEAMFKVFEIDLKTLTDRPTIRQEVQELSQKNITFPNSQDFAKVLRSQHLNIEDKVVESITRTLHFYGSQLDDITKGDTSLALKTLKDIDDKHGKVLQRHFALDQWIQRNCDNTIALNSREETFYMSLIRQWKNRSGTKSENMVYWKAPSGLEKYLNQIDSDTLENIGNENEGLWGILNIECQEAVVDRCEMPYVCERTLLDPTPRSQYLLHQIIQRLFVDNSDCPNLRSFATKEETYEQLCTKADMEAQFLDLLDVPILQRDLFAELVGFCGYLGYTNFFREDWLDRILSWQSKSNSGCFIEDPLTPVQVFSNDMGFERRATRSELEEGIEQTNEKCLPHLTAVSLTAVTAYWDYLMDLKTHH